MEIKFDYRFDSNGFFNDSSRREALEKAGEIWSSLINDEFENIPEGVKFTIQNPTTGENEIVTLEEGIDDILIFVGANTSPFGGASTGEQLRDSHGCHLTGCCCCQCSSTEEDVINLSQPGILSPENLSTDNILLLGQAKVDGTDLIGDSFQRRISDNFRDQGAVTNFEPWTGAISFNSQINWDFSLDNPNPNQIDFVSVALHEIGHVLGIGTAPIFDIIGAGGSFDGVNALAENGGNPIPLESDLGHVKEGFNEDSVLLDPTKNGGRNLPTNIDLALLADIGYEIDGFTPQGSTPAIATAAGETIFGSIIGDNLNGLQGDDQLQGGIGNDTLQGGEGNDLLFGQDDRDLVLGGNGNDQLQGNSADDTLKGNAGNDSLFGQDGNDLLFGNGNDDQLTGGLGDDTLVGGTGDDIFLGGDGSDRFLFEENNGKDTINDFVVAEDTIEIAANLGFANGTEVLNAVTKTGVGSQGGLFSEITLSSGNTIAIFHDSPLTADNFVINIPLQVTNFQTSASGFVLQFNQSIDVDSFNLAYNNQEQSGDLADLTLVRESTGEIIRGSAIWNEDENTLTFVKTGGILATDDYTLTLFSRQDGLVTQSGTLLDGDGNGIFGDDFTSTFKVENSNDRVLSIDDFSRAPGQAINFPAKDRDLAITIDDGEGISQIDFTLTYDSEILDVQDILVNPDLAGDWKITEKNLDTPGQANISLTGETSLTSGEVELVFIDAKVPDTATYGDSGLVQIESLSLNGGSIAGVGDVAVEQVAYLGDASGNGSHNGLDASLMAHFSVGVNSGFDAYRAIDPLLIGDINSDGNISSLDAGLVARQASGGSSHLIPN